eukprot:TRINITY_DN6565_c0_g1_i1.p1 TRINITY_DN6565_c0_g1~~TRINITY_DN6565_c0_g1_i1.p1  ORF type:complete len:409 (+),score=54.90 TRINITY_DN6565_c0_g1_i1:145-1371(+)
MSMSRLERLLSNRKVAIRNVSYHSCMLCHAKFNIKGNKRRRCSGCHSVFYDDVACQKKDWATHKLECKPQQTRLIQCAQIGYPEVDTMPKLLAHPEACGLVGALYAKQQIYGMAIFWMQLWCKGDDSEADFALASMYLTGAGESRSDAEGVKVLRRACDRGNLAAMRLLGDIYSEARHGVRRDDNEAAKLYRTSAEGGHPSAQNALGLFCEMGRGVKMDDKEAVRWYRKSADQGDELGLHRMGRCYAEAIGVTRNGEEAARYFRRAAEKGYTISQTALGELIVRGQAGDSADPAEAFHWWSKAAQQNDLRAMNHLGESCSSGFGVPRDTEKAMQWFRRAAELGSRTGQYNYALCLDEGTGVERNPAEAEIWYSKAEASGVNVREMRRQRQITRDKFARGDPSVCVHYD